MDAEVSDLQRHQRWMTEAIALAAEAGEQGEVPVGAVVVSPDNQLVATGVNRRERDQDPTAHAEVLRLKGCGAHPRQLEPHRLFSLRHPRTLPDVCGGDRPQSGQVFWSMGLPILKLARCDR
jgi:tRNA(Arg) A34 adenosine deaminase TadA